MLTLQFAFNILLVTAIIVLSDKHKRDIEKVYQETHEERQKLLDRIMANNIQEYKAANGQLEVKRSATGNYLADRMLRKSSRFDDDE